MTATNAVSKITRKQLYVAAKTIDLNSHILDGATMRSYDPDYSDESVAELVGATVPQIRRLRIDIFGAFLVEKKQTAKERLAEVEAELATARAQLAAAQAPAAAPPITIFTEAA